ncbi:uncharacterized protein LOC130729646 isoform X2 [Lotus japonicus]|uniref:uncharacterized protein LOC130729646 isoform X2 n=1 Tax=Lotus japonicus TaxID=34305 RepID=UPI002587C167|nr:uncharacterized protein LOC130729646 isoform X2 [Lotus japonicus]
MVVTEEQKCTPTSQKQSSSQNMVALLSPRFKSAAAKAGWDEEALLLASLIVEDTPERDSKHKRRSILNIKTPPLSNSKKVQRSPQLQAVPVVVLDLDAEDSPTKGSGKKKKEKKNSVAEGSKGGADESNQNQKKDSSGVSSSSSTSSALPCIDKLKEELSCAICLEICFEPSTTPCGHSFCRKCLRSAADKCGKKCPKCRQLISNGRSCTINTVLWNTIQLLFPQEVEARKAAAASALNTSEKAQCLSPETAFYSNLRNRSTQPSHGAPSRGAGQTHQGSRVVQTSSRNQTSTTAAAIAAASARVRTRRVVSNQDEDAALALRLQREEFLQVYRGGSQEQSSTSLSRANLRAMASRAMNLRIRDRRV